MPHHQLDVLDVTETASVAAYQRHARRTVEETARRGRTPVIVGGSGLYVQALLDDLEFPGTDPEIRARFEAELASAGAAALHARLAELDPAAAAAILPGNERRIVRALEVIELTGRPFSATMPKPGPPRYGTAAHRPGPRDRRTRRTRRPTRRADVRGRPGRRGPRPARRRPARGPSPPAVPSATNRSSARSTTDDDFAAAATETAKATRRFVRRQRSWFRRDKRINWLAAARPDLLDVLAQLVDP